MQGIFNLGAVVYFCTNKSSISIYCTVFIKLRQKGSVKKDIGHYIRTLNNNENNNYITQIVENYYSTTKRIREHSIAGGNLSPPLPPPALKRQRRESLSLPQPTVPLAPSQQNCSPVAVTRMSISAASMEAPNALSQSMDSVSTVTGEEEVG